MSDTQDLSRLSADQLRAIALGECADDEKAPCPKTAVTYLGKKAKTDREKTERLFAIEAIREVSMAADVAFCAKRLAQSLYRELVGGEPEMVSG
jgi:hypothetical protein